MKYNNLFKFYKYLGTVTFKEVLSLIYHSVAVIQPSKFEGRSSTVEQAKSMGKKIILSNIDIHKEQNPLRGKYFSPDNFNYLICCYKLLINTIIIWRKNI